MLLTSIFCRLYQKRVQQSNAIRVLQRNGISWMKLRNWQWWRLFTKVKPLLEVTNKEEALHKKEDELRQIQEQMNATQREYVEQKEVLQQVWALLLWLAAISHMLFADG